MNPPQGGMGSDPWRPPPNQMPPPPAPQQQQDGSHWNQPPSGPPVNAPPSYQRPPPPPHQQNSSMPPAPGLAPFQQPQPPYQSHNAMSPPSNTRYPMPPLQKLGGASQVQAPPPGMDNASRSPTATWRASPEYSGGQSPSGGSATASDHMRRRDPRTKYAHLKIKSKGQTGQSNSQPILKRSAGEAGMDLPASGFKIPKLLQDSSALNRPMDPGELFGGKDALSVGDEREQGAAITTPFGAFRSMFPQAPSSESEGDSAESAGSSQKFGEITMGTDPQPTKDKEIDEIDKGKKEESSESTATEETKETSNSSSKPTEVPSYLAHLNMGLGDDLKIDSAFGSLSDKSTKPDDENSEKSSQDSQARKLPSIFGFS